jgi:hypothetical protein
MVGSERGGSHIFKNDSILIFWLPFLEEEKRQLIDIHYLVLQNMVLIISSETPYIQSILHFSVTVMAPFLVPIFA